jgi:hypothetical protein
MTSNPAAAVRMLVIYSICIPLAGLVGWMLTNQMDYGTLGFFGLIAALLLSPILIRYHYPIMIFGMGAPIYCFFLKGNPPMWEVVTIISLTLAIVDRALNSEKRFVSVPMMTWPLLFALAVTYMTAELTGGIGLKTLGGSVGGGKKYLVIFIGIATYFALTSRVIPKNQRRLYMSLFFLAGLPTFIGDLFPFLPSPFNYVNLLIPPSQAGVAGDVSFGSTRLGAFAGTAGVVANFLLARYGLRGIFTLSHPLRGGGFILAIILSMLGGFRSTIITYISLCIMLFFMERLYRTQMSLVLVFAMVIGGVVIVPFSDKLPNTFQRSLSFIPFLNWDADIKADAEGSKQWREAMWRDLWPKVPQYLLLGKGLALTEEDFTMMGNGTFANMGAATLNGSEQSLAISGDYHNGPLSTLIPFGIWGGIAFMWLAISSLYVLYRNYRYGDADMKTVNAFLLAMAFQGFWGFFVIFGDYAGQIGLFAKLAGFSIALNWCVCGPAKKARVVQRINRMGQTLPV